MIPRRIAYLAALVTAAAAGWYFFSYLEKWEWNRAIVSGVIFQSAPRRPVHSANVSSWCLMDSGLKPRPG